MSSRSLVSLSGHLEEGLVALLVGEVAALAVEQEERLFAVLREPDVA